MNKSVISIFLRSFASSASSGIRGRLQLSKEISHSDNADDIVGDEDDLDEYEGDFMNSEKTYKLYEKEKAMKNETLKRHIVMSRYFNTEKEPNFLTYMEKKQIKTLHESDPEEWTVEKLSNSFPVLPHIVKKIIKSKWEPSSTYQIIKYDNNVMENWKKFRAGELPVSYQLKVHLLKFKDRKISVVGREELAEKFVPPKFEMPKPKSRLFISIAEGCVDKSKSTVSNNNLLNDGSIENEVPNPHSDSQFSAIERVCRMEKPNRCMIGQQPMKFNEFIEQKIDQLCYESPTKSIELLEKCKEYEQEQNIDETTLEKSERPASNESMDLIEVRTSDSSLVPDTANVTHDVTCESETSDASLTTFIKERNKKITETDDYTLAIKIPKHLYQKGMTYRIKDCYYDDDGEFLYRVIGM